ncbi:exodeoxyribonuclease VII small subunit [Marinivivus vitaminiproducens]|uniref:exodeoxyribonuclease VII small subunit n=1 Tax=Marinivivus vitaminiproducens TaxID=3035935 RepID=UPI0027A3A125|nr:exodeoxyribonuclease VII small subunit [Geminicoccaceae bacterium SCSIO 64248]
MSVSPSAPPTDGLSFEQALAELEQIVQQLERGQLDLEAAIAAYARGTDLRQHCERKLKDAELKVQTITAGADGSVTVRDAALDDGVS